MTVIQQEDFIESVADALQYISYYHPVDYITEPRPAYEREQSPAAKDAIAQILINCRMCAEGHRPICQDTGIVNVFVKVGMDVRWAAPGDMHSICRRWSTRASAAPISIPTTSSAPRILADPAGARKNTKDNTPAVVTVELVRGDKVDVTVAAKGGGSEAKSKFVMLNPSDSIVDWVLKTVPTMGAGWCPPGMLGIGIGGTAEKAMLLAKEVAHGSHRHPGPDRARPENHAPKNSASNSTTRSTASASARRASAASPPCSTSRCSTTPPTPPICPSP